MHKREFIQLANSLIDDLDTLEGYISQHPRLRDFTYQTIIEARELHQIACYETRMHMTTEQVRHFMRLAETTQTRMNSVHSPENHPD